MGRGGGVGGSAKDGEQHRPEEGIHAAPECLGPRAIQNGPPSIRWFSVSTDILGPHPGVCRLLPIVFCHL